MARNNDRDRDRTKRAGSSVRPPGRKRSCAFCQSGATWIDYKDTALLRRFLTDRGKIRARGVTGNCAQHQRDVAVAIKTAREVALVPYAERIVSERGLRGSRSTGRHGDATGTTTSTRSDDRVEDLDLDDVDVDVHELEEVDA